MSNLEGEMLDAIQASLISCVGVDDKIHVCESWEDIAVCGIPVKRKNVESSDYIQKVKCNCECMRFTY